MTIFQPITKPILYEIHELWNHSSVVAEYHCKERNYRPNHFHIIRLEIIKGRLSFQEKLIRQYETMSFSFIVEEFPLICDHRASPRQILTKLSSKFFNVVEEAEIQVAIPLLSPLASRDNKVEIFAARGKISWFWSVLPPWVQMHFTTFLDVLRRGKWNSLFLFLGRRQGGPINLTKLKLWVEFELCYPLNCSLISGRPDY